MASARTAVLAALLLGMGVSAATMTQRSSVTPIQKVLTMMNDMLAKAKAEKEAEEVGFAAYKQFCTSSMKEKGHAITKAKAQLEQLGADIAKYSSDASVLSKEIGDLDADIG